MGSWEFRFTGTTKKKKKDVAGLRKQHHKKLHGHLYKGPSQEYMWPYNQEGFVIKSPQPQIIGKHGTQLQTLSFSLFRESDLHSAKKIQPHAPESQM